MKEIEGDLDLPTDFQTVFTVLPIEGWAFSHPKANVSIEVSVDDQIIGKGKCSFPRYDVFKRYSNENSYISGFKGELTLEKFQPGKHFVKVFALTSNEKKLLGAVNINKVSKKDKPGNYRYISEGGVGRNVLSGKLSKEFVDTLIELTELQPRSCVLDVGCGMGKFAVALTKYLEDGEYCGLDNMKNSIEFCEKNISTRYHNFKFTYADIFNAYYNPSGKFKADKYRFPYEDRSFDVVWLFSVFTHLRPGDMNNYLNEIARVLKNQGICCITFYLLNEWSIKQIKNGKTQKKFKNKFHGFWSEVKSIPEQIIGYEEQEIRERFKNVGLEIQEPILYGSWTGSKKSIFTQDLVIAKKII